MQVKASNQVMVLLTDDILKKIKTVRLKDDPEGYQRGVKEHKVLGIIDAARKGMLVPPVILAEVDGVL